MITIAFVNLFFTERVRKLLLCSEKNGPLQKVVLHDYVLFYNFLSFAEKIYFTI